MTPILDNLRAKIANGMSESDAIAEMRRFDLPILEAIKTVRELFQVSLGAAKQSVGNHPAYSQIASASDHLHEQFIQVIQKNDSTQTP
jgi:ribosomal protein L7/L12